MLTAAKAFNEGCDARIRGEILQDNPYNDGVTLYIFAQYWRLGWSHVHKYWGCLTRTSDLVRKSGWVPKPLPIVGDYEDV